MIVGGPSVGNPHVVAEQFEWLTPGDVAPYLVQKPNLDLYPPPPDESWWQDYERLNVPARPGDEFTRFNDCAVLDFLRLLDVPVELRQERVWPDRDTMTGVVCFLAPVFRQFWMKIDLKDWHRRMRNKWKAP